MTGKPMKRTAKPADLPPPSEREAATIRDVSASQAARPARPRVKLVAKPGSDPKALALELSPTHSDGKGWGSQMCEPFGTTSKAFVDVSILQLTNVLQARGGSVVTADQLEAALALLAGIAPADELEGAMGVQMVGIHGLMLEMLTKARHTSDHERLADYIGHVKALGKLFADQMDALGRKRTGGKQVHEVVYVDARHSQNVIQTGGRGGGRGRNRSQPYAPAMDSALDGPALLGSEPLGEPLSGGGDPREEALQATRRQEPRSAEG